MSSSFCGTHSTMWAIGMCTIVVIIYIFSRIRWRVKTHHGCGRFGAWLPTTLEFGVFLRGLSWVSTQLPWLCHSLTHSQIFQVIYDSEPVVFMHFPGLSGLRDCSGKSSTELPQLPQLINLRPIFKKYLEMISNESGVLKSCMSIKGVICCMLVVKAFLHWGWFSFSTPGIQAVG